MPVDISDKQIESAMSIGDFVESCDAAFRLYGSGDIACEPRAESVTQSDDSEVFRLELAADWPGVASGRKVIIERSDVSTGRLGERSAVIELTPNGYDQPITVDAELITNQRTGAAAALGARYLAGSCERVGIIGTGRIAESVALAVDSALTPDSIVVTSRKPENRADFVTRLESQLSAAIEPADSIESTVSGAGVVVVCVPTPEPVLGPHVLDSTTHVSVVAGDPRTVQLQAALLQERPVVVDQTDQARKSGDFVRYDEQIDRFQFMRIDDREATIGDAALGKLDAFRGRGCVTYFTGMAVQDLHAAQTAWSRLSERPGN